MIFIVFIGGLLIGSFLNCVIFRMEKGESAMQGRSYCPKCGHTLGVLDLIPVLSFVFLKSKCRYCKSKISWQYPLVELAAGVLFALVYLKYYSTIFNFQFSIFSQFPISNSQFLNFNNQLLVTRYSLLVTFLLSLYLLSTLIIIFIYDLKHFLIPHKITLAATLIGFFTNLFLGYSFTTLSISVIVGAGFFGLQYIISKGKWIGTGDIWLGALMGVMLPWPSIFPALVVSYLLGSIAALGLLCFKKDRWGMKSQIPFGPFLVVGTILVFLFA